MASSSETDKFHRFSRYGQDANNLRWSDDHRLAITTPELVFVCTLLSPTPSTSLHKPAMIITMATLLPTPSLHTVELPRPTTLTEHLDPAHTQAHLSHDTLTHSQWSPLHCNTHGGCVLTCQTAGGRVIVYTPPHSQWKEWKHTHTLTDALLHTPTALTLTPHNKASFTFCTAFSWLPHTLDGGHGLVAMATRSGHLVITEMSLPISEATVMKVMWVESLAGCDDVRVWGCSLVWQPSQEHTLIVGCTDGRVLIVDYPTGHMTTVWDADSLPVQHLVFLPHHLVFTKGCMLMVCELEEGKSLSVKGKPLTLSGVHSLPVSGLVATNRNAVLSSGLDGTLQVWEVGDDEPRPLKTGAIGHVSLAVQGLAVSHNSLLAAVIINERMNQDKKQGCTLHFISLADETMAPTLLPTVTSLWDILVCVSEYGSNRGLSLQQLMDQCCQSGGLLSRTLTLQESILSEKPHSDQVLARQTVLCESARRSLDTEGVREDAINKLSTSLAVSWLSTYHDDAALQYKGLCEWDIPGNQTCPICGSHVTLTEDLLAYVCSSGHSWSMCPVSFVLASVCSECVTCAQCKAVTNTLSSLTPSQGSWLYKVLTQQNQCVYCSGFYEKFC